MSDATHYLMAHATQALLMARILPEGPTKSELSKIGSIYHRLAKQGAGNNIAFLDDVREARNMGLGIRALGHGNR
jgi:hypothetical protein